MSIVVNSEKKRARENIIRELESRVETTNHQISQVMKELIYPISTDFELGVSVTSNQILEQAHQVQTQLANLVDDLKLAIYLAKQLDVTEWVDDD